MKPECRKCGTPQEYDPCRLCGAFSTQKAYDHHYEAERLRLDREHNCINTYAPLLGWELLRLERWKPGVVRFHARKQRGSQWHFQMGYAPDEVFSQFQVPK